MLQQSSSEIPASSIPRNQSAPGAQGFFSEGNSLNPQMQLVTDSMLPPLERSPEMMDLSREIEVRLIS